jgi:uncharacterized protein (TIGR00369 family)
MLEKTSENSRVEISQLMNIEHTNLTGNVHGGWITKLVDEAGALASMRHANNMVVTVAIDQMTFKHPIRVGDLVILQSEVTYTGNTSIETEVKVFAENPLTGERWFTNKAYIVFVAIDENGRPIKVPSLVLTTEDDKTRFAEGKIRQKNRVERSQQNR